MLTTFLFVFMKDKETLKSHFQYILHDISKTSREKYFSIFHPLCNEMKKEKKNKVKDT